MHSTPNPDTKIVLASYGVPGVMAVETLFSLGYQPRQIFIWTYEEDERNRPLASIARQNKISTATFPANSLAARNWLREIGPDVIFSLHFRDRIPRRILEIPSIACVNLHPSLLPKYRGCFSAPWVIINGEEETGYSFHYMVPEFDAGNIVLQQKVPISPQETGFSLFHKLIVEPMKSFSRVVELVVTDRIDGKAQSGEASYYGRCVPFDGKIDPGWDDAAIDRFIRAMYFPPFKGAVLEIGGKEIEVNSIEEYRRVVSSGERRR